MSTASVPETDPLRLAAMQLLAEKPPLLIEVRFPKLAAAPDWFLCDDEAELDTMLGRLGAGAEIHLHSVWDLKNTSREIVLRK